MKFLLVFIFFTSLLFSKEYEYYIQVLSSSNQNFIDKMKVFTKENGYEFITRDFITKDKKYIRLLIGPYKDKKDAFKELSQIKKLYQSSSAYVTRFSVEYKTKDASKLKEIRLKGYEAYREKDFKNMMKYLYEASKLGDSEATYYIGKNYHHGYGVKKNIKEALIWYQKCEDKNICLESIASIYMNYDEVSFEPNLDLAKKYLIKSSSKKAKSLVENWANIIKAHNILRNDEINIPLVQSFLNEHIPYGKIQNIQIANKYVQDNNTNININFILDSKVRDAFLILKKNSNGYWKDLEFKLY